MAPSFSRAFVLGGILALTGSPRLASAQTIVGDACCPAPVVQTCYQTVPVTELRECRQTVQRPVCETKYVDQQVTEYRQVTETKSCQVPTVCYQNVTECQTIQRDCGHWETRTHCRPTMSACEYDGRDDILGAINRASYNVRMAFTPKVSTERYYVPNIITQTIPVTRQVAVQGVRTVNYQVSRLVPYTTTRKVAINTVRMVAQEIVTQQPVTVMKTVPVGLAYGYGTIIGSPTATAVVPTPAPVATATLPREAGNATTGAEKSGKVPPASVYDGDESDAAAGSAQPILPRKAGVPAKKSSLSRPVSESADEASIPVEDPRAGGAGASERQVAAPSAVTVGRWVARKTKRPLSIEAPAEETLISATEKATRR